VTGSQTCSVDHAGLGDAPGLAVHGEIDINAIATLEHAIERAILGSAGAFVIDLTDVDFLDSSGLALLTRARALLGREDRALAIVCPPGPARRAFEVSGTSELFVIYGSRDAAVAGLRPAGH
jgi:anti-sigma B factor antagonist